MLTNFYHSSNLCPCRWKWHTSNERIYICMGLRDHQTICSAQNCRRTFLV